MTQARTSASVYRVSTLTDDEWAWSDTNKEGWKKVTDGYYQFYEHWRDSSTKFCDTFAYTLSLIAPDSESVPSFDPDSTLEGRVLVTKAYDDMFHRPLRLRSIYEGRSKGVVLTGQPGISVSMTKSPPRGTTHQPTSALGETTFLKFMLARLISARTVMLLCDATGVVQTFGRSRHLL